MWTSSSSRSLSSSTCSSSPSLFNINSTTGKTMEEVWKGITLNTSHLSTAPGVILQDFFSRDPPPAASPPHHHSPVIEPSGGKRFPEFGGDRRQKRMIKNRESAARSRARKQAYTNELELEVAQLMEENARLKEQQEQLYRAAAAQHQKRKPLHRTLTAPF